MPLFTKEDAKIGFNFFCCVYGIGTLGIPANFARAGPMLATTALIFMGFTNICACVALSKVTLAAPKTVSTYGDVGEWCAGKSGRYLVVVSQFGICLLVPCAFLVLGGILLDEIIPGAFAPEQWSVFMAISVLPMVLTPTLKEGASAALAGCIGTIAADIIGLYILGSRIDLQNSHRAVIYPDMKMAEVAATFGNLALAFSGAVIIPELQHEHSQPTRMPRIVGMTMALTSLLFFTIGITAFIYLGCQVPGNLLFAIAGSSLNLNASRGSVVMAYLFMQMHITIATPIILNPVMYLAEREILGMHKRRLIVEDEEAVTWSDESNDRIALKDFAIESSSAENTELDHRFRGEYAGTGVTFKYMSLRVTIVIILLSFAVLLKDHFLDITDFVGASSITMGCIILPIAFYLKVFWQKIPQYEKCIGISLILVCSILGLYVTYISGRNLFSASVNGPAFPFCPAKYNDVVYTNTTYYNES